ncbi:MAG TPA: hypothetical protein VEN12_05890 [Verrucomicrobiae bacterium]|nr:hypothetical protein [Verrucomicrobiae bacterium]
MGVDVSSPKPLDTHPGDEILGWARGQLAIAREILDNPGGGLLFATQTIGQVRSGLHERDGSRWQEVTSILERAEDAAVHREFDAARDLISQAASKIS